MMINFKGGGESRIPDERDCERPFSRALAPAGYTGRLVRWVENKVKREVKNPLPHHFSEGKTFLVIFYVLRVYLALLFFAVCEN